MEVPYKLEVIALTTIIIKLGVSVFPYSGKNQPPKFGDYEAQRHWMEITVNLPIQDLIHHLTHRYDVEIGWLILFIGYPSHQV
jgi:alpha-1,3-glucosyltransferase